MLIVNERWDRLKAKIRPATWDRLRAKAEWEGVTLSGVVFDWPQLLPKRLRPLAAACFVTTRREWLEARRHELRSALRYVERELARSPEP